MDLKNIMLREISQSEKDKHHMISFMWNLRNKLNKQNRGRLIENRVTASGEGLGGRRD